MTAAERYRDALAAGDREALMTTLAPTVRLRSPITEAYVFEGHDDVGDLFEAVYLDLGITGIEVIAFHGDEQQAALFHRATIGGVAIEEATRLRMGSDGLIDEITLHIRPLPALTGLMARLGPALGRRRGRGKGPLTRAMGAPLALATQLGEGVVPWVLRR